MQHGTMETMQNCVRLFDVAADVTAFAIVSDAADAKLRNGRLERDVTISAPYPSPAGAAGVDGPNELCTVSLKLFLPWRARACEDRAASVAGGNDTEYAPMPTFVTQTPSLASVASNAEGRASVRESRAQTQVRTFVETLVRGRVAKHPREDGTWILRRSAFNSTASDDLASGRGPTALLEHMALVGDELDDPHLGNSEVVEELRRTKSRLPRMALLPFSHACRCVANATIGGGHGAHGRCRTRASRFGDTFEIAEMFYDTQECGFGKRQLQACVAMHLVSDLSFFCLVATDKVLKRCAYKLPAENVGARLPELAINIFTRDVPRGKKARWLDSLRPPRSTLYKYALGTAGVTAGVAWALMKSCGFSNPAMGAESYGEEDFGAFVARLQEADFHRNLFSGPAQFRATPGRGSKPGSVSQLPLSVLSDEQYGDYLGALPCKDKFEVGDGMHVPAIAIAVGRCLPLIRRLCQDLLDGNYQAELRRVLSTDSALQSFQAYLAHAASGEGDELVMLNMTRHVLRTGFGAAALAAMLVDPGEVDKATWDMHGVPSFVTHLVCVLTHGLHNVLNANRDKEKTLLPDVVPKVLLPMATFSLKWGEVQTTTAQDAPPDYSGGVPHGYSLGNEYDFEPEALRGGKQLSKACIRWWVELVQKPSPHLTSLQDKVAREMPEHPAADILPRSQAADEVRAEGTGPVVETRTASRSDGEGGSGSHEDIIQGSDATEDVRVEDTGPVVEARTPSRLENEGCSGSEVVADVTSTVDAKLSLRESAAVADAAPVVAAPVVQQGGEVTQAAASVAGPVDSGVVQTRTTPSSLVVPREHMRCHLGDIRCESTRYTSLSCFVSRVLFQDWGLYGKYVEESARSGSFPASEVGNCYENPSDAVQHVASLAWAEASVEIFDSLRKCDESLAETGMYRNSKDAYFPKLGDPNGGAETADLCDHCKDLGAHVVQVEVHVGCQVTETPGWEGAGQRHRHTFARQQRTTLAPEGKALPLKEDMMAVVYPEKAGSRLVLAYVRAMSERGAYRAAHCVFLRTAFEDLRQRSKEENLRMTALYSTTQMKRMLEDLSVWQTHGTKVSRVGGEEGLPAVEVRADMNSGFDPILECLANPSVFFRLRNQCKKGQVPGLTGIEKVKWVENFTQPSPPKLHHWSRQTFEEDFRWRKEEGRRLRVETIDKFMLLVVPGLNLNAAQLEVVKDQQRMHVKVWEGKTEAPRRVVFVKGGGGVGKSALLGPLISLNLVTNAKTKGHPLSYENLRRSGRSIFGASNESGTAVVGIFAEMNRSLDASVAAIMRPKALRTADDKPSLAKIFRVGSGCEDSRVEILTLKFMATAPLDKLHPAWRRPPADADPLEKTKFEQFEKLREDYKRADEEPQTARRRYLLHQARIPLLDHLLENADIIAATISAVTSWVFERFDRTLHTVYVDECAKAPSPQLLHLLMGKVGKRSWVWNVVLIGDDDQILPHSSTKEIIPAAYMRRSLFGNVARASGAHVFFLDTQYRMHPTISKFPSLEFYGGKLKDGLPLDAFFRKYHRDGLNRFPPVLFLDTTGEVTFTERRADQDEPCEEAHDPADESFSSADDDEEVHKRDEETERSSCANDGEAKLCVAIAETLVTLYPCGGSTSSPDVTREKPRIMVIAPYLSQKRRIEALVKNKPVLHQGPWEISVLTAERAQGEQADVVIVSTVRSQYVTQSGPSGYYPQRVRPTASRARARFVSQRNRLAVMCTRARYSLIFIGDSGLLASNEALEDDEREAGLDPPWKRLVAYCKEKGIYRRAVEAQTTYNEPREEAANHPPKRRRT